MNRHLALIGAILGKDLRLVWPLAAASAGVIVAYVLTRDAGLAGKLPPSVYRLAILPAIAAVGVGLFLVSLVQQDSAPSLRRDWLTRPIPSRDLLVAKALFIAAALAAPLFLAEFTAALLRGFQPQDAALVGLTALPPILLAIVPILAMIGITGTLLDAAVLILICLFAIMFSPGLASGARNLVEPGSPIRWIVEVLRVVIALAGGALVLWLQYARRRTALARLALVATAALLVLTPKVLPWSAVFAVQTALAPEPRAADDLTLTLLPGCFPTYSIQQFPKFPLGGGNREQMDKFEVAFNWTEAQRRQAGPHLFTFDAPVRIIGAPAGWRILAQQATATYVDARGNRLDGPLAKRFSSREIFDATGYVQKPDRGPRPPFQPWLTSPEAQARLAAQGARLRLEYDLTLLKPGPSQEFAVDGRLRRLPGLGYCAAKPDYDQGVAHLTCQTLGGNSAVLDAVIVGEPDLCPACTSPNFSPAALDVLAGRHRVKRNVRSDRDGPWRIRVTPYEAVSHTRRQVVSMAPLGQTRAACPRPAPVA